MSFLVGESCFEHNLCLDKYLAHYHVTTCCQGNVAGADGEATDPDSYVHDLAAADSVCEADMLARLLESMENEKNGPECEREPPLKKQRTGEQASASSAPSAPGDFKQLDGPVDMSAAEIPPGCSLNTYQGTGSPYVQARLPAGRKFKGFNSHSRSFDIEGSSKAGRARLTENAAKAQVVAWLWSWWNVEGSKGGAK